MVIISRTWKKMKVNEYILNRWSPVAFSDKAVNDDIISLLFEAASWAPSSFNAQPWKFIWGRKGEETYKKLYSLLNDKNKVWAETAPVLILGMAELIPEGRKSVNRFASYDTGMAVSNLLLQATYSGLFVHQMGGYDTVGARSVFKLPENYEPQAMMAVGYKGSGDALPPEVMKREHRIRERKKMDEFVFRKGF